MPKRRHYHTAHVADGRSHKRSFSFKNRKRQQNDNLYLFGSRFIIHMRSAHLTISYCVKGFWVALNRALARASTSQLPLLAHRLGVKRRNDETCKM